MAENYSAVVTELGASLIEDAYNNSTIVNITQMAIGDSNGAYVEPNPAFTSLVNELGREDIHESSTVGHLIHVYVYVTSKFAGDTIREFGLYDDANNLVVYAAYPESLVPDATSGEYIQLEIECIVDLESVEVVNIVVNPIYPHATELEAGIAKIVSETDVDNDEEDSKFLTIKKLLKRAATTVKAGVARFATSAEAINGTDTTTMLNPSAGLALLKSRISSALDGTRTDYSASEDALRQVNEKADYAYNPSNLPPYTLMQTVDLSTQDAGLFYPLVLNGAGNSVGRGWTMELASQGGASTAPYNATTLVGYLRGGGYSDYDELFDVNVSIYDEDELTIHSAWQGTEGFPGVVIYLRGGSMYYLRTNDIAEVHTDTSFSDGNSVFPAGIAEISTSTLTKASLLATFEHSGNYNNIGVFNTENPPTPAQVGAVPITRTINSKQLSKNITLDSDDIGSLKGKTVKASFGNQESWIKIATAYLPSSSSTIKIQISGGGGFNAGSDYQSSAHQIIARAGNSQGDANCRLHTQDMKGCPFSQVGVVHTGSSQFDIYAKSRSNYSHDVIVEYTSTNTFTVENEVAASEPTDIYIGDVVEEFNTDVPPSLEDIGIEHIGKAAIGTSVMAVDFESESYQEYYDYGDDDFNLVSFDPSKYETQIYYDGYYLVDVLTMRGAIVGTAVAGINVTVKVNDVEYMHGFVSTEDATGRNPIQMRRVIKLLSGDKVRVYSDQDALWLDGGSIEFQYLRPLAATKKAKDNPKLTIEKQTD
ncbi:phage tail protein [Vibrio parahaemolyticus]|nr:phage tail protein [Vibrio parahaemolyticus]